MSTAVRVDLTVVRANAERIHNLVRVECLPVVKADAYGLGAGPIVDALSHLVSRFCCFSVDEVSAIQQSRGDSRVRFLLLGPHAASADVYQDLNTQPSIRTLEEARMLARCRPALNVDTGMQRLGCSPELVPDILQSGLVAEAWTHAVLPEQAALLKEIVSHHLPIHAAGTALLELPDTWLDGVRPGLALYHNAVTVTTHLLECHRSTGPVGYTRFASHFHGVIPLGYSHGLPTASCLVADRSAKIVEVGMQTAYVVMDAYQRPGAPVLLLGDGLSIYEIASETKLNAREILLRYSTMGPRTYVS